jgi:hypothetical protein
MSAADPGGFVIQLGGKGAGETVISGRYRSSPLQEVVFVLKFSCMALTQKNLARDLSLTKAAVSMALRNHSRIGDSTQQKVQQLAWREGYLIKPAFSQRGARRLYWERDSRRIALVQINALVKPVDYPDRNGPSALFQGQEGKSVFESRDFKGDGVGDFRTGMLIRMQWLKEKLLPVRKRWSSMLAKYPGMDTGVCLPFHNF